MEKMCSFFLLSTMFKRRYHSHWVNKTRNRLIVVKAKVGLTFMETRMSHRFFNFISTHVQLDNHHIRKSLCCKLGVICGHFQDCRRFTGKKGGCHILSSIIFFLKLCCHDTYNTLLGRTMVSLVVIIIAKSSFDMLTLHSVDTHFDASATGIF